ncbi:MAG: PH domain-containing protein [Fidelibacterota bacterium]
MEKSSPDQVIYLSKPHPGTGYLMIELLFLVVFILVPQIQCKTGCFIWTPWRIFLFGVIYLALFWHLVDSFRVKYVINPGTLEIRAPWYKKRVPLDEILEIQHVRGFSLKVLMGWSSRNVLNRYKGLVKINCRRGDRYLVSPDHPEEFLSALKNAIKAYQESSHGQ